MPAAALLAPVTMIEGIGPAVAQRLAAIDVHTVADLLRATPADLHQAARDVASLEQADRWRRMAAFLQVEGMSAQWAEALAAAGFDSLEALHGAGRERLRQAFDAALAAGRAPDAPSDAALAELRIDLAALVHTGALNVTVRDERDAPLPGASVRAGTRRAITDARGRARLLRLPLGRRLRLVVENIGFATAVRDVPHLLLDEFHLGAEIVTLLPAPAAAPRLRLSEYEGDVLPARSAHAMTTEARPADALRDRDVLILRRFYDDGTSAQLTSKFLDYRDGEFIAVSFRVPRALLPGDAAPRQHFLVRGGRLERIAMNATRLDLYQAMRRARAAIAGHPPAQTITERDQFIHEYLQLVMSKRRWTPR